MSGRSLAAGARWLAAVGVCWAGWAVGAPPVTAGAQVLAWPDCGRSTGVPAAALDDLATRARVLAYGEGAHGGHEFLVIRNQILAYLVRHHGYTVMAAETHPVHAELANAYLRGERELSDEVVDAVFSANRQFHWQPGPYAENRALLRWMRAYNDNPAHRRKIRFHGIDGRHPWSAEAAAAAGSTGMGAAVLRLLAALPGHERIMLFAHHGHVQASSNSLGRPLRAALGQGYQVVGSVHGGGRLNDGGGAVITLPAPQAHSLNARLDQGPPCYVLRWPRHEPSAWLDRQQSVRGSYWAGQAHYFSVNPARAFDALVVVREVSPLAEVGGHPEPPGGGAAP